MQKSTNLERFDNWMSWKENAHQLTIKAKLSKRTPKQLNQSVSGVCLSMGLRPMEDFQVTMYEVRFRTKTFLAMFKMNFNDDE